MAKSDAKDAPKAEEVEAKSNTQLAEYAAYEEFAGSGFENQTSDDYSIPFIQILQALSPQIQENDALKQGQIINTVTGEVFESKTGISFIPATTQHQFVEFKPREQGGGFVGTYEINDPAVLAAVAAAVEYGKYSTTAGNDLIETFYVYGIAVTDEGQTVDAVMAFSGAKIKKYKAWMTKAKTIQIELPGGRRIPAPLFSHRYRLKTVLEKNPKGNFYNWDITFDGENAVACRLLPGHPLFQAAVAIKGLLDSGKARAAYDPNTKNDDAVSGADGGKPVF